MSTHDTTEGPNEPNKVRTKQFNSSVGKVAGLLAVVVATALATSVAQTAPTRPEPVVLIPVEQVFGDNAMDISPRSCLYVEGKAGNKLPIDAAANAERRLEMIAHDPSAFTRATPPGEIADGCGMENFRLGSAVGDLDDDGFTEFIGFPSRSASLTIWWNNTGRFAPTIVTDLGPRKNAAIPFVVDADGDGDADLGLSPTDEFPEMWIFLNNGKRNFSVEPVRIKTESLPGFIVSAATGDLNNDGLADVAFSLRNAYMDLKAGTASHPIRVMLSTGDDSLYREVTTERLPGVLPEEAINQSANGVSATQALRYMPFALVIADFDRDGRGDIFAAGDYGGSRIFFQESDRFVDLTQSSGVIVSATGMGAQVFDANGDGRLDILSIESDPEFSRCVYSRTCDMTKNPQTGNRLLINQGDRTFTEESEKYGLGRTGFGWTFSSTDLNGDGYQDILVGTGELVTSRGAESWQATFDKPYLMLGGPEGWKDYSGDILRNIRIPGMVTMLLSADFDGDFRPDVLMAGPGSHAPYLLLNRTKNGSWGALQVRGKGSKGSPTYGEGSEVTIEIKGKNPQTWSLPSVSSNYHTQGAGYGVPIGFGDAKSATVTVRFPSGVTVKKTIKPNQINRISES